MNYRTAQEKTEAHSHIFVINNWRHFAMSRLTIEITEQQQSIKALAALQGKKH
jgi:hypothetical protein